MREYGPTGKIPSWLDRIPGTWKNEQVHQAKQIIAQVSNVLDMETSR